MLYTLPLLGVCLMLTSGLTAADTEPMLDPSVLADAKGWVEVSDPSVDATQVALDRTWEGPFCLSKITNKGERPVRVKEIVLFRLPHALPPQTEFYGEGFTMLSQTGGTLEKPENIGGYLDKAHYRLPQPEDATVVYELLLLAPPASQQRLLGFTSCRRFVGRFYLRAQSIDVVQDTEGKTLEPGETWTLEEFCFASGDSRVNLLTSFAGRIAKHHPRLRFEPVPAGWCSWYCFGPMVTAAMVEKNLRFITDRMPALKYVQIDDGYQAAMGDWLETGKAFKGGIQDVLRSIRDAKFEPAIWAAPFIAEENSHVFKEHPDWFIKDDAGQPLRSDRVTFGGWRNGPWYAMDGTHPEVQKHLESLFRTMRQEWGCTYFKLDANFWGAMHGGTFHDPKATRVEAYRRGMEAVLRGAGDAFILGCNHPLWPSLGLIHGSRSSNDIERSWDSFSHVARETFSRNWQNGVLWWNDPDCVLLSGNKVSDDEFVFHATVALASGGMLLSGDNLPALKPERLDILRKLVPPAGVAAKFDDNTFTVGRIDLPDRKIVCVFNWTPSPQTLGIALFERCHVSDFWTGKDLGTKKKVLKLKDQPPHSARVLVCTPPN